MLSINTSGAQGYCKSGLNILNAIVTFVTTTAPYTSAPTVGFSGGGGTSAAGTATLTNGGISGVSLTNHGTGYTSAPTVAFTGGGGSGAAGTAVLSSTGSVKSAAIDTAGTTYTNGTHALVFAGGGGTGATGTATVAGGIVTGVSITGGGTGYTSAPSVSLAGTAGAGDGAFSAHTVLGYTVDHITMTSGGGSKVAITDSSVYDTGDSADVIQVSLFDKYGAKIEKKIAGGGSVDVSIGSLNPTDGIDMIVTVVSTNGNRKDGSIHDLFTTHTSGNVNMEL